MIQLLTLVEAAQELQITVRALHRLLSLARLSGYRLGRKIRFSRADLNNYLRWRASNPQKAPPWHTRRGTDRLDPRPVSISGYPFWQVELGDYRGRRRGRRTFTNREEAVAFAEQKKIERRRAQRK